MNGGVLNWISAQGFFVVYKYQYSNFKTVGQTGSVTKNLRLLTILHWKVTLYIMQQRTELCGV